MTGRRISHYVIGEPIGRGGMGVVYKAEDTKLHRTVALKFLPADSQAALGQDQANKERFLREARIAARLNHPHICPIYDVDEADGKVFFAMAYIEGEPLGQRIQRGLSNAEVLELGIQIASGLDEARRQGVVHRDIKTSNIMVSPQGHAYILDFGLALAADSSRLTVTGGVCGTPSYMSPEQVQGQPLDHRSDVWALGVVLYEMLSGRRPFQNDKDLQVLYAIVHSEPAPLATLRPDLPPDYPRLVTQALAKDPAQRWQTAGEMAAELRRLRDGRPSAVMPATNDATATIAMVPATATATPAPAPKVSRTMMAVAALTVAGAAGLGYLVTPYGKSAAPAVKHIAVLPFTVIGGDDNLRALADGLVETLTSRLSDAEDLDQQLMVVPASEIRARKIASAEAAHRIYGANLVVTGSAERIGSTVQLLMNLIDGTTKVQTGSRSLQFELANPLPVRDTALAGLVRLLQVQSARMREASGDTASATAYTDYLRGRGYLARYDVAGNLDLAIAAFDAATQADPNYAQAYAALGEAAWRKAVNTSDKILGGRALAAAERAVALDPKLAAAHSKLGDILAQSGRREEALTQLQTALRLDPGNSDAHRALGPLYESMARLADAERAYQEVTQRRPGDWFAHNSLGVFYYRQNRYAEAAAAYERARTITPENEFVRLNLASVYIDEGRYAEAQKELDEAVKLRPTARAYMLLGVVEYYRGRMAESASASEQAVKLDPGYAVAWGTLGSAYRRMPGEREKAAAALRRAVELTQKRLELTPGNYSLRANLAEYQAKLGDAARALQEIAAIPAEKRGEFRPRLAIAYEAAGKRAEALAVLREYAGGKLPLEVLDEPELKALLTELRR